MGIRFELFCDLIRDCSELTVELLKDLAHLGSQALDEMVDDPITYTIETIEDLTQVAKGGIAADCLNIKVRPLTGSVVYCKILGGVAEHSGIYVGNNQIVHLNGSGLVECIPPETFLDKESRSSFNAIYVAAHAGMAVGSKDAAKRARNMIGSFQEYDILQNNCHRFVSGCLTGDLDNADCFLWMLKHTCRRTLGANSWCIYDYG